MAGWGQGNYVNGGTIKFYASGYNSIYGKSSTVQPYSIKAKIYIRIS